MPTENLTASQRNWLARWIVVGVLLGIGVFFAFPVEPVDTALFKILDVNPRRAVGFLSRLWLYSAPVGAVVGIIFGNLVLRSSHPTLAIITRSEERRVGKECRL